jgi:hypothetical protein
MSAPEDLTATMENVSLPVTDAASVPVSQPVAATPAEASSAKGDVAELVKIMKVRTFR